MFPYSPALAVLAVGGVLCYVLPTESYQYALALVLLWAAVGGSWNIISG